ncbi:hypothetical protein QTV44_002526 [Vibrio vulnificus]|nr:hypothetical protein [Vibrio vulnificus]
MKNGSIKNSVILGALMWSAGAMGAELEVSMFYPADMATRSDVDIASEVVGFYYNLEWSNALMAAKGANLVLKPTKIEALAAGNYTDPYVGVSDLRNDMISGTSEAETNVGHIAVGIGNVQSRSYGRAQPFYYSDYDANVLGTRKLSITHSITMSGNATEANSKILLHEILHTIGGQHSASGASVFDSVNGYDYGYSTICDNGLASIMDDSPSGKLAEMSISGAQDCVGDGRADMVTFINTFAPRKQTHVTANDNQTVTLSVTEDIDNQAFHFIANRSDTTTAETMTLYVAGGKGYNISANSLTPMDVEFALGSATSNPVTISFTDIHPMFEQAHASYQSTYAVVIGRNEVQDTLVDVLNINTQWSYDDGNDHGGDTNAGSDGGGGSLGISVLAFLGLLHWRRRIR